MKLLITAICCYAILSLFNDYEAIAETPLTPYDKCMVLYGDTKQAYNCDVLR